MLKELENKLAISEKRADDYRHLLILYCVLCKGLLNGDNYCLKVQHESTRDEIKKLMDKTYSLLHKDPKY